MWNVEHKRWSGKWAVCVCVCVYTYRTTSFIHACIATVAVVVVAVHVAKYRLPSNIGLMYSTVPWQTQERVMLTDQQDPGTSYIKSATRRLSLVLPPPLRRASDLEWKLREEEKKRGGDRERGDEGKQKKSSFVRCVN